MATAGSKKKAQAPGLTAAEQQALAAANAKLVQKTGNAAGKPFDPTVPSPGSLGAPSGAPTPQAALNAKQQAAQAAAQKFGPKQANQPPQVGAVPPAQSVNAAQAEADKILKGAVKRIGEAFNLNAAERTQQPNEGDVGGAIYFDGQPRNPGLPAGPPPHYFSEQTDHPFFPDVRIFVCGADVSPHLKGSVTYSMGLNNNINSAKFTLDNSHDKFTLKPQNLLANDKDKFNTRSAEGSFREYSEAAKAKIYFYKDNKTTAPGGQVFEPNTPAGISGRRLPLSLFAPIFHRMDPVRIFVRTTPFDEWIPAFTGYITHYPMDDNWVTHEREISITCHDIRELMRKMRVQRNSLLYSKQGATIKVGAITLNRRQRPKGKPLAVPTDSDPTGTQEAWKVDAFWQDQIRQASRKSFAWAEMSYRQVSECLTVGGQAPIFRKQVFTKLNAAQKNAKGLADADLARLRAELANLDKTLEEITKSAQAQGNNPIEHYIAGGLSGALPGGRSTDGPGKPGSNDTDVWGPGHQAIDLATSYVDGSGNGLGISEPDYGNQPFVGGTGIIGGTGGFTNRTPWLTLVKAAFREDRKRLIREMGAAGGKLKSATASRTLAVQSSSQTIRGIGRMDAGGQYAYSPGGAYQGKVSLTSKSRGAKEVTDLEEWYSLCLFGSATRNTKRRTFNARTIKSGFDVKPDITPANLKYWSFEQIAGIDGAGTRCRWDDIWAPDNQLVHWLLPTGPGVGAEVKTITEIKMIDSSNVASTRQWTTRFDLLNEFSEIVDYKWWVTGTGDIVFEFPMYDFDPLAFKAWENVMVVDKHAINSNLDQEAGDPPTVVITTGTITGNASVTGQNAVTEFALPPHAIVYAPLMASRLGIKILVKDYPYIRNKAKLNQLAVLTFQKALGESERSSVTMGWRPWLLPNKPLLFVPRDRMALIVGVTNTMQIHGECSTSVELQYTRLRDETGIRRYISGGARMPISFAMIPGKPSIRSLKASEVRAVKQVQAALKFSANKNNPALTKFTSSLANANTDDRNTVRLTILDADGKVVDASGELQKAFERADREAEEIIERTDRAVTVHNDFIALGPGTGVHIGGLPVPKQARNAGASGVSSQISQQSPTALNQGKSAGNLLAANGTANGPRSVVNGNDVHYIASVITNESAGQNISPERKAAIGWAVVNSSIQPPAAKSNLQNVKSGQVELLAKGGNFRSTPRAPSSADRQLAIAILTGKIEDPTNGAEAMARATKDNPLDDLRLCKANDFEVVIVDVGNSSTGPDGEPIVDAGAKHVFFRRKSRKSGIPRQASTASSGRKMSRRQAALRPFIDIAAKAQNLPPEWLFSIYHNECEKFRCDESNVNPTGDVGPMQVNVVNWANLLTESGAATFPRGSEPNGAKAGAPLAIAFVTTDGLTLYYQKVKSATLKNPWKFFTALVPTSGRVQLKDITEIDINSPPPKIAAVMAIISDRKNNVNRAAVVLRYSLDQFTRPGSLANGTGWIPPTDQDATPRYNIISDTWLSGYAKTTIPQDKILNVVYKASLGYNQGPGRVAERLKNKQHPNVRNGNKNKFDYGVNILNDYAKYISQHSNNAAVVAPTPKPNPPTSAACKAGSEKLKSAVKTIREQSAWFDELFTSSHQN